MNFIKLLNPILLIYVLQYFIIGNLVFRKRRIVRGQKFRRKLGPKPENVARKGLEQEFDLKSYKQARKVTVDGLKT